MQSTFALLTRFAEEKQRHTIQSRNFQCKVKFVIHANAPRHILRSKSHKCAVRSRTPATCSTRLQRPFLILFPRSAYHCPSSRIALDCIQTPHLRLLVLPLYFSIPVTHHFHKLSSFQDGTLRVSIFREAHCRLRGQSGVYQQSRLCVYCRQQPAPQQLVQRTRRGRRSRASGLEH